MKKILWFTIVLFPVLLNSVRADEKSFTNLQHAVDFIATSLESTNDTVIASACLDIKHQRSFEGALYVLRFINKSKPLRDMYADKSFPADKTSFTLGGHNKELGHVHICFIQTNGVWKLENIFECK